MKTSIFRRVLGIAIVGAGILSSGSVAAGWYGDPWSRPYGSGAVTYQRQTVMRDHGYVMKQLSDMFDGRRSFNRDEAARLARELQQGFGDNLIRNFPPGTMVAGSRTLPATWRHFDTFVAYAKGAEGAAYRLAEVLAQPPSGDDADYAGTRIPPMGMGPGRRGPWQPGYRGPAGAGQRPGERIPLDAVREFGELNANCHSCHMLFRGGRW